MNNNDYEKYESLVHQYVQDKMDGKPTEFSTNNMVEMVLKQMERDIYDEVAKTLANVKESDYCIKTLNEEGAKRLLEMNHQNPSVTIFLPYGKEK